MPLLGEIEDKGEKQKRKGTHTVLILMFPLKCRTFFKASRQQGGPKFSHREELRGRCLESGLECPCSLCSEECCTCTLEAKALMCLEVLKMELSVSHQLLFLTTVLIPGASQWLKNQGRWEGPCGTPGSVFPMCSSWKLGKGCPTGSSPMEIQGIDALFWPPRAFVLVGT